ncbi:hypothetical protein EPR50_G00058650 [Perca flavescens]|uniref:Gamma-aminobutyric acid type B receptor subunit 2 n=1 Tax=Perca flavescens TaxID=8167 RepID=A0A484D9F5_PERFV|nr:gamma-aminobutyric acid type B receptor subunit 2-like isoform X1 [Perca flavescens]TDH11227.1 hypothetical protein EPR50_G00058650 [Perca flavescens]
MQQCGRAESFRLLLVCLLVVGPTPLLVPVLAQLRHPVPVLWMMPGNQSAGVAPAVRLALQDLKRQVPPLGDYEIQLQLLDSQCDPAESLRALFDAMWAGPKYLLLFGGVCPSVTALIARSLPALNLLQVSFAASSPSLSNRKWYGNLFSTLPSDRALNQATVKLLQRYKWTRVGVLTQDGHRLSEMKKDLLRQLLKVDIDVVSTQSLSGDVCSSLRRLKERDVRIIVVQFDEDSASEVFCCAYRLNMFGARYQWMVVDGGAAGWSLGRQVPGCTADSLQTAADGSIRLQTRRLSNTNTPGVSGRTPQDYEDSYLRQLTQDGSKVSSTLHSFAYDAVWVAARALSQALEAVKHREKYDSQRNGSIGEEEVHKTLLDAMKQTQFQGVTGPVFFRNGERMTSIELIQFQDSSGVLVGDFSTSTQQLRLMNQVLMFKGPGPARDRAMVLPQRQRVDLLLHAAVSYAAAVTIFITLTVLFFTAVYRKHWLLRASGASWDVLLLLAVLLSSSSVLIAGLDGASQSDRTFEVLCSVRLWTLSVGHTVGFAVLFTKTWRLYSLRRLKQTQKQRAGCVVLWIFLLDVFVLTTWQILDPLRRVVLQHGLQSESADQDIVIRPYSELCSCTNMELWLTAVYGYRAALLGLGCFVAWSDRAVPADNPAVGGNHLALSVFAVTVFSVSGAAASLLTSHNPPLQFCLTSVLILCCDVFTLGSLFGPKLLYVCANGSELQDEVADGEEEERERLRRLNQQLKSRAAQLDVEIETITRQLRDASDPAAPEPKPHRTRGSNNAGGVRSVRWTHAAQVCSDRNSGTNPSSPDSINSPERVRRRVSMQLPILHHAYLPAVGGVSASSSSLFGGRDAFAHSDDNFLLT